MKTIIFLLLLTSNAFAAEENWFCTSDMSKFQGSTFYSCGMGEAYKESDAREDALRSATHQFRSLCEISSDCKERRIAVRPTRTSCEKGKSDPNDLMHSYLTPWKCYTLLLFTIE